MPKQQIIVSEGSHEVLFEREGYDDWRAYRRRRTASGWNGFMRDRHIHDADVL